MMSGTREDEAAGRDARTSAVTQEERRDVPPKVRALAHAVREHGGRALLVGGCVRDYLLNLEAKDWDVEVYGIEPAALRKLLARFGKVNTVGEAFTVYKLGRHIDVSLPRRERKQGRGHRGFVIEGDPHMSVEEAARRRDFTINAILQDPLTGEILDPFDGRKDLHDSVLRHVAAETFTEDSLRVLRAAQFAARFSLTIAHETIALCRGIKLDDLPAERIWGEMEKLLLRSAEPSHGLRLLKELNATAQLFPELAALADEAHTFRSVDRARALVENLPYPKQVAVMLAALCHDFGASETHANAHAEISVAHAERFLDRLKIFTLEGYDVRAQVLALVGEHRRPFAFFRRHAEITDGDIRRLARRCEPDLLYRSALACALASMNAETLREGVKAAQWFIARVRQLGVEERAPAPLLMGRHLQESGLPPSPLFKRILDAVYEIQLDGSITNLDEARAAAEDMINTNMYD